MSFHKTLDCEVVMIEDSSPPREWPMSDAPPTENSPPEPRRFKSLEISKALIDEMSACRKASEKLNLFEPIDPFGRLKVLVAYFGIMTSMWGFDMLVRQPGAAELFFRFWLDLGLNIGLAALLYTAVKCYELFHDWWYGPPAHTRAHYKLFIHLVKRVDAWLAFLLATRGEPVESLGGIGQTAERYQTKIHALCKDWDEHLRIIDGADVRKTDIHDRIRHTISDGELKELKTITTMLKERGKKKAKASLSTVIDTSSESIDLKEPVRVRGGGTRVMGGGAGGG